MEDITSHSASLCAEGKARRSLLLAGATMLAGGIWSGNAWGRTRMSANDIVALQQNWRELLDSAVEPNLSLDRLELSKAQWRERLDPDAYHILRREGTERAGSHEYNLEKREGVFACAGCELPLFTSAMKYDSGTGWPSFFTSIPGHLGTKKDFKLVWPRTEYHCIRCGGHQGHVFNDGPAPTGQRFCNNGLALVFWPRQEDPA